MSIVLRGYSICHDKLLCMYWRWCGGVAVVLVLAAASVRADDLHLDVMQDELKCHHSYVHVRLIDCRCNVYLNLITPNIVLSPMYG